MGSGDERQRAASGPDAIVQAQVLVNEGPVGTQVVVQGQATFHLPPPRRVEPRKSNLPPRRHDFVGRQPELAELHRLLTAGTTVALDQGPTPPSGLTGLGGVGKSTLATEYAYRHLGEYEHICWVNAEGANVTAGIAALADDPLSLGLLADAPTLDRARAVLARLERGGPHLLILDNVSEPDSYSRWLPQTGAVRVIVTTRRTDLHGVRRLQVEVLPEEEALRLMLGEHQFSDAEREAGRKMCRELGCLTLAVAVAGRLLETRQRTPSELLALVQKKGLLGLPETKRAKDVLGTLPSVERLFDASVALLDENDPVDAHARRLLWVGGWFAPVEIPRETFFDAGARLAGVPVDEEVARSALERLMDLGLVQVDERGWPKLHRLVGAFARGQGEPAALALLDALEALAQRHSRDTLSLLMLSDHRVHLELAYYRFSGRAQDRHYIIPLRLAQLLLNVGNYDQARLLCVTTALVHSQGPFTAALWHEAGQALHELGCYQKALEAYGHSATLRPSGEGPTDRPIDLEVAITLDCMGHPLLALGRYGEALDIFQKALKTKRWHLGPDDTEVAVALNGIGQVYMALGLVDEAQQMFEEALDLWKTHREDGHPWIAYSTIWWAKALAEGLRKDEAMGLLRQAHAMIVERHGDEHPWAAFALLTMGNVLQKDGRHAEAVGYLRDAVAIRATRLGANHPRTAWARLDLGRCLRDLGDPEGLRTMCEATDQLQGLLGHDHPDVKAARAELS